ncbi:MAG TPA: CapA family protein [Anaerolineales bacterium]|nr:CapA family protein [Anaerolineales bacterium]
MMRHAILLMICALLFVSCTTPATSAAPITPTPINMAFVDLPHPEETQDAVPTPAIPTATHISTPRVIDVSIWAPPYLAETLGAALEEPLRALFVPDATQANIRLEVGEGDLVSQWVYALVTPFSSTMPGVSSNDLLLRWQSASAGSPPLLMDQNTYDMFSAKWGPAAGGSVQIMAAQDLVEYAWSHQPALAIVPFESLEPRWRVLAVDGLSPIHKDFALENYPLKIPISLNSEPELSALIKSNFVIPPSNRDPQKMTVVALTGVTALVRATAFEMEQHGMTYPAQDIRDWLLNADITHISNEVPFALDCPYPDPVQADVRFCSRDNTIQLLEDIGTDVVELTGDHFQDWGTEAMFHTLDLYRERGWLYYGGGANLAEGRKALLIDKGPNRIAFIGCNAKGGSFAQASETDPGAAACDIEWMAQEISRLKGEGYLVIATFQHLEYYTYAAQPDQQRDFRRMAEAGAVVVSGSQAHQPQGMEFLNGSFIHYGLGNLFFDQYGLCEACRQGLIDQHVFYAGRYISTELLPIQFVDYARSRPMTFEEANDLFQVLFQASGWQ